MAIQSIDLATLTNQTAAKAVVDDTNARVKGLQTSVGSIADALANAVTWTIGPCRNLLRKTDTANGTVSLKWEDSANTVIDGVAAGMWVETTIVKKQGAIPTSPTDGTVVVTTTTRDQYATTWYVDSQASGDNWEYRAFPKASNGYVSDSVRNVFKPYINYGFIIDETNDNEATCVTYTDDATGFDPLYVNFTTADADTSASNECDACVWGSWRNAFFMPKPCMLKRDGTVDYYLDPANNYYKADGVTASDIANSSYDGNAMMEFPAIFVKVVRDTTNHTIAVNFASAKLDADYECYPCLKSDGTYADNFYLPIFEGTLVSNCLRSIIPNASTKPLASTTSANELAYARANGEAWCTTTWADEDLVRALGILVMRRLDCQSAIGYMPGESTSALTNYVGTGARKGMFYGHSGVSNPINTKFFGMENWWGHRWRRPQGCELVNGKLLVKLTKSTQDGSNANDYGTSDSDIYTGTYIDTGISVATNWSASFIVKATGVKGCMFAPRTADGSGSSATYFCDAAWSNSGVRGLGVGGNVANGVRAGLFASALNAAPSYASWDVGASLSYHHL